MRKRSPAAPGKPPAIKREQGIRVSADAFERFVNALAAPLAPNDALRAAATDYRRGKEVGERYECDL